MRRPATAAVTDYWRCYSNIPHAEPCCSPDEPSAGRPKCWPATIEMMCSTSTVNQRRVVASGTEVRCESNETGDGNVIVVLKLKGQRRKENVVHFTYR